MDAVFTRGFAAAIPHLQRAIAIDPQFAMAQAHLGFFYWNMGQTDLATKHALKAYELRDRVSDRERLFILFVYDRQVTGNLQKELETIESWVQAYPQIGTPGESWADGARGAPASMKGEFKQSEGGHSTESRLSRLPLSVWSITILALAGSQKPRLSCSEAAEHKVGNSTYSVSPYYLAFLEGDEAGMKREIDRARGNLETEDWMSHNQALVLAHSGQMRNARIDVASRDRTWRNRTAIAEGGHLPGRGAVCEAHFGNRDRA